MSASIDDLAADFRLFGVSNPEFWAQSELKEGFDQTARATVLKCLADLTAETLQPDKLARVSQSADDALARLRAAGVDMNDVGELCMQSVSSVVWNFLRVASGIDELGVNPASVQWALVRVDDESGNVIGEISALYESWLEILCYTIGREEL